MLKNLKAHLIKALGGYTKEDLNAAIDDTIEKCQTRLLDPNNILTQETKSEATQVIHNIGADLKAALAELPPEIPNHIKE